jgi:hypothetical protein
MNLGAPLRRGVAHGGSHQLSLPPIQLSQVLRPASRFKPAAQHISNPSVQSISPSINQSARWIDQSISHSVQSINHSSALNPSIHASITHSIHLSIHPLLLPARHQSIDRSVMPINRSISPIDHHQRECNEIDD